MQDDGATKETIQVDGEDMTADEMAKVQSQAVENKSLSSYAVGNQKSPVLGGIGSFFMPGFGQIYGGNFSKGMKFFIVESATSLLLTFAAARMKETVYETVFTGGPFPPKIRDPFGEGVPIRNPKTTPAAPAQTYVSYKYAGEETNKKWLAVTLVSAAVLTATHVYNVVDGYRSVEKWNHANGVVEVDVEIAPHTVAIVISKRF